MFVELLEQKFRRYIDSGLEDQKLKLKSPDVLVNKPYSDFENLVVTSDVLAVDDIAFWRLFLDFPSVRLQHF